MKTALVPILSGVALALMAGAAGSHYFSVRQMVELAAHVPGTAPVAREAALPGRAVPATPDTMAAIENLKRQQASLEQSLAGNEARLASIGNPSPAQLAGNADVGRVLQEILSEMRYQRDQIAETNRDLMELQFRVDSHSEQFRPLKLDQDGSGGIQGLDTYDIEDEVYDTAVGVLPPLDLP